MRSLLFNNMSRFVIAVLPESKYPLIPWLLSLSTVFLEPKKVKSATAAAAKSCQSCPTLCDHIDGSPSGFSIPGILQARILEWVAISFSTTVIFPPTVCYEVMGLDAVILVFLNVEFQASFFTLLFHFLQEALQFLFAFCYKGDVICISEVIDISPGNLDSSLCR